MIVPVRSELTVTDNVPFGQPTAGVPGRYSFFALTLENPEWKEWHPGQFIMMRPADNKTSPQWARPFSICRVTSRGLVLFFRVLDSFWERFARLKTGDKVVIWGPLGTFFTVQPETPTLLLARGVGLAPFAGYADRHPDPSSLFLLFGHTQTSHSYPTDAMSFRLDLENVYACTPEGLEHFHALTREKMRSFKKRGGLCLACGPMSYLYHVWKEAVELELPTQLSLEQRMACGTGACLGCVTVTSKHWADPAHAGLPVQTCTSGPVFWASDIDLDARIQGDGK